MHVINLMMDSNDKFVLPVINMAAAAREETVYAKRVVDALENEGFLYIDDVDVDFKKLLSACKWFFSLSDETKATVIRKPYNPNSKHIYRGLIPIQDDDPSRKEKLQLGKTYDIKEDSRITKDNWMYEESPWPKEDGSFPFKEFMLDYHQRLYALAMKILRLVSIGLGLGDNAFEETFGDLHLSSLRLLKYQAWHQSGIKPPPETMLEDGRVLTLKAHADTPFLTLLHTFDNNGLEILDSNGKWQTVPCRPNGLVMNIGDTFTRMMDGRFKATVHRVIDINKTRYSVPYFLEPNFYADVGKHWMAKWTENKTERTSEAYGPWVIHRMKHVKYFPEAKDWPEFEYNIDN